MYSTSNATTVSLPLESSDDSLINHDVETVSTEIYVNDCKEIRMLLLGRRTVGKTTLIDILKKPKESVNNDSLYVNTSRTFLPALYSLSFNLKGKAFCLKIIDTPGFEEIRRKGQNNRLNDELEDTIATFIKNNIINLHIVCFVIDAKDPRSYEPSLLQDIQNFLGKEFRTITPLIITHCEDTDPNTAPVLRDMDAEVLPSYIGQKIFKMGALEKNGINTVKLNNIMAFRQNFLDFISTRADNTSLPVSDIAHIKHHNMKIIDDNIKIKKENTNFKRGYAKIEEEIALMKEAHTNLSIENKIIIEKSNLIMQQTITICKEITSINNACSLMKNAFEIGKVCFLVCLGAIAIAIAILLPYFYK